MLEISSEPVEALPEITRWARISALQEGQTASCRVVVTAQLIRACAEFSGDFNSVHCDWEAARQMGQSRPVAHGLVSMALISRLIGMELPGPGSVWFHQEIDFLAPVRLGDEIEARAKADISVSKVSLRLPSGHGGQQKSYHRRCVKLRDRESDEKSLRAIELHHFQAVLSADFMFHAIEVILDGLFGKREVIRDLLVA